MEYLLPGRTLMYGSRPYLPWDGAILESPVLLEHWECVASPRRAISAFIAVTDL